tara:strand:+ start:907 stop:1752 length:846 start_codon:yes stop_codon:yes gene_type:complete
MNLKVILKTIRINNFVKNVVIFTPFLFSGAFLESKLDTYLLLIKASLIFYSISCLVYIMNDISDKEQDLLHPKKKDRPIASGEISSKDIFNLRIFLLTSFLILLFSFNPDHIFRLIISCGTYYFMNILYTYYIKKISNIIGSLVISVGFFIRLYIGAFLIAIDLKFWLITLLILSTFLVSILKKYSDSSIKNKKDYYAIIIAVSLLVFGYFIHLFDTFILSQNVLLLIFNIIFVFITLIKLINSFIKIDNQNDPVFFFLNPTNFLIISLWFVSYIYLRYIL